MPANISAAYNILISHDTVQNTIVSCVIILFLLMMSNANCVREALTNIWPLTSLHDNPLVQSSATFIYDNWNDTLYTSSWAIYWYSFPHKLGSCYTNFNLTKVHRGHWTQPCGRILSWPIVLAHAAASFSGFVYFHRHPFTITMTMCIYYTRKLAFIYTSFHSEHDIV